MLSMLSRNWWLLALRGLAAVLFGLLALILPGITLLVLVTLFGIYALFDGVMSISGAIRHRDRPRWWALLLEGVAGIAAGILAFVWPGMTAVVLLYLIAAWAVVTGVLEIVAALKLRAEIDNEWALGLAGLASIVFGVLLFVWPGAGLLSLVWLIGLYALLFGLLLIALAFRVRGRGGAIRPAA